MPVARLTHQQRQFIQQRDRSCCQYCISQARYSSDPLSIEHTIPGSKGGTNDFTNLAVSCQGCNNLKYNHTDGIDPITGELAPLYHPQKDNWFEHFTWSQDFSQILGLTPTGRATITRLQLNREDVVNLRQALVLINQHPPAEFYPPDRQQ
jgi:HNH endonuclease